MELSMTPMIDVVFLLLVFFLATASFEIIEGSLPGSISETSLAAGDETEPLPPELIEDINDCVTRISKLRESQDFTFHFNGDLVSDRSELIQRLQAIVRVKPDIPIIVHPDNDIPIGVAVDIYDQARAAGGLRVYFATP
jgi:biopolymer transport protein ExbD